MNRPQSHSQYETRFEIARCSCSRGWWGCFIVAVIAGIYLLIRFTRDQAVAYTDDEEHFKYGSTGGERASGIPVSLWNILPDIFQKYLPGKGLESLGFIYETNRTFPIGVSERNVQGVDRVFLNCAVCHTGTVRDTPSSPHRIISGNAVKQHGFAGVRAFSVRVCARRRF